MSTGNSFTPGSTTVELYLRPLSQAHIFPFAFHLHHGQSPPQRAGSVSVPANRQRAGVPWKQVVTLRVVALKKKGDKVEQSVGRGFSMLGLPLLSLMDPAKNHQKTEEKSGLLHFAQISLGARAGSRCVQEFNTAFLAEDIPGCGSPCPQLVFCHRGWRSGTEM